ncbi:MAG: hypothetical protein P8J33_10680, partial [Pirellulaceae bacterium]|nr:hypothetical protein [Pirellulaceae bacterium]
RRKAPRTSCKPGQIAERKSAYQADARKMREQGMTYRKIAKELNRRGEYPPVAFKTVGNWLNPSTKAAV